MENENTVVVSAMAESKRAIEAILLVSSEPTPTQLLAQLLEMPIEVVEEQCQELAMAYDLANHGFQLVQVAGGWRYQTHPDLAPYVERFAMDGQSARLSTAATETLAIVAYKQPISRAQVSAIRGVNVDAVLRTLVQRGYVEEVGRDLGAGQAVLFGTTQYFLERVGLNETTDLPALGEFVPSAEVVEALEQTLKVEIAPEELDIEDDAPADPDTPSEVGAGGDAEVAELPADDGSAAPPGDGEGPQIVEADAAGVEEPADPGTEAEVVSEMAPRSGAVFSPEPSADSLVGETADEPRAELNGEVEPEASSDEGHGLSAEFLATALTRTVGFDDVPAPDDSEPETGETPTETPTEATTEHEVVDGSRHGLAPGADVLADLDPEATGSPNGATAQPDHAPSEPVESNAAVSPVAEASTAEPPAEDDEESVIDLVDGPDTIDLDVQDLAPAIADHDVTARDEADGDREAVDRRFDDH